MQGRTFFRIMLDILFNNAVFKALTSFVNFCNEQRYYNRKELKFLKKVPLNSIAQKKSQKSGFVFNSITGSRINPK